MGLPLERWLWLLSPLFSATIPGKKTAARKKSSRPRATSRQMAPKARKAEPRKTRTAKTGAGKTSTRKAAAGKANAPKSGTVKAGTGPARVKAQEALKAAPAVPLPKPAPPIGRPILLLPENGKYADSIQPKFRWLSVGGANRYEVVWSEEPNFAGGHSSSSIATEATVPPDRALRVGATYYWRVRGGNEGGWGPWSTPSSFQVLETPPLS